MSNVKKMSKNFEIVKVKICEKVEKGYIGMKLFCIPYAGGCANIYWDWKGRFAKDVELVAVEYSGHGSLFCEKFYKNVDEAAEDIVQQYFISNNEPYVIYGHSLGSLITFEIVYKIREAGLRMPEHIILAGTRPPHLLYKNQKYTDLPMSEFMDKIFDLGNTPREILENDESREFFYDILLSDMKMVESYSHNDKLGKLDIPVTVYTGIEDDESPQEDMREWNLYTEGEFTLKTFNGNHFFAFCDGVKEQVYKAVEQVLRNVE